MNNVILLGRMAADPELKTTPSGIEVTSFRIAVDRPYQKDSERKVDFIDIVAWRKTAAFVCQYFSKGKPIIIKGSLQTRSYEARDGSKRYVTEVLAESVEFVPGSKSDGGSQPYVSAPAAVSAAPPQQSMTSLLDEPGAAQPFDGIDEDLPF